MESDTSDVDNDVPDTGAAFTFGKSKNQQDFIPEKYYFKMDAIKQVCCGDRHTAILTQHGKLYTFGSNDWGQLGHGHNNPVPQPKKIKALRNEPVHLVACGRCHTLVYTASGKLYSCGINTGGQLGIGKTSNETSDYKFHLVAALSGSSNITANNSSENNRSASDDSNRTDVKRITQLECGADHSLALTSDGTVYSWGENDQGQLGLGDCEMRSKPTAVSLVREGVKEVSCGYYHSAAVTVSGKLWTWGDAESGQLGLSNQRMEQKDSPECVLKLDEAADHVSCGSTHTAVITKSGKLYTFGTGKSGQLGLGPKCMRSNLPKLVENMRRTKSIQVKCGENHTAVLNEKGQLVMFGDGRDGKLCQVGDEFANVFNPVPVLRFKKFKVLSFSLGGTHSVVVAAKRDTSASGGFDDSDDEGGLMSDEDDDMAKFDYLGGTSMLRMASTRSVGRKSATLPVPGKMGGNKLSPRDRRRVKKIEEEKERLNQTLPVHWTTKLGSLPDLSIPDLPISSSTQEISIEPNQSDDQPVARVRTIKSKPLEGDEGFEEDEIVVDDKRSLRASAPDLFLASQSESVELKSELADEVDKEKREKKSKEKGDDSHDEDDDNGDTASLNTTHDSPQENEENEADERVVRKKKDEGKKKGGKILGLFGRKKSTDEDGKETSVLEKDKDKKSKKHEETEEKDKSKEKDKKNGKNGKDKEKEKEKEKEKKDKKSDKDKSKDDDGVSGKKVSFAAELDLDLSEDSWAEDEKDKGKKGKKNKKKDDKEKDKDKDKDKEKENKKDKKSKKEKEDKEKEDDESHETTDVKKDEKEEKKKSKFSLFGGKKFGSKESVDHETSEVMEFGASDNDTEADDDDDRSTHESQKDKKSKDKKSKDKDKEKEKDKKKDKDKKKKNGDGDQEDEADEDSEEADGKKKNGKKDGKDKDKKDKKDKEKDKSKGKEKDKKGKDKEEKKDSKKAGVKSADSVTSLASSGISDDIEEIYSDLEDVSGEEELGASDEEDSKKKKKDGKKEKDKKGKEKEKDGKKDKEKEKDKDGKKDKEKEKEKEKKDKGKDDESPDEKSSSKKAKKKVTIKDDKGSIDDDEEEEITPSKKKGLFGRFTK